MEKEIQVRKKRFAAFWAAALLVCSLSVPMLTGAVDANGLASVNENLQPLTNIRAGVIYYVNDAGETVCANSYGGSGGWVSVSEYSGTVQTGYRFSHWVVTATSSGVINSGEEYGNVDYPQDITLQAVFAPEIYKITYDLAGGTGTMITEYTVETETFTLNEPTKTGYTFRGWLYDGQTEPVKSVLVEKGTTGTLSYTADWLINQYTITFDTAGGSAIAPITEDYGTAVTAPAAPTRDGYYFAGWDQEIPDTIPEKNVTITAQWTPYVIEAGTYDLKQGVEYKLGSVTQVSGDSSTYASGSVFYVPADGSYTFS